MYYKFALHKSVQAKLIEDSEFKTRKSEMFFSIKYNLALSSLSQVKLNISQFKVKINF